MGEPRNTTATRAPLSDLAHRLAEAAADVTIRHAALGMLELPIGGKSWRPAMFEIDARLGEISEGCPARARMILWEATDELNDVLHAAIVAELPMYVIGQANAALALLMLLMRREMRRNPTSVTHH